MWTVCCTGLDLLVAWAVFQGLDTPLSSVHLAVAQCAHALTTLLPFLPNATGVPYAAAGGVLYEWAQVPLATLAIGVTLRSLISQSVFWSSFSMNTPNASRKEFGDQAGLFDWMVRKGDRQMDAGKRRV